MITEQETKRYEVNTARMIEASFTDAYDASSDAPVVSPPEKSVMISSILSMVLIAAMCGLTFYEVRSIPWLIIGILALGVIGFIVYRYIKALKKYEAANSAGSARFDYKNEYTSLFPELPDRMNAYDFTKEISAMQNKQRRDVYNNAIRNLITKLNMVNNPQDVLCRNLTTYGELFSKLRKKCYLTVDDGKILVYDADFLDPRGELVIDTQDLLGYGDPATFPVADIKRSGTKISQDAVIIAIKTDEEGGVLYLESHTNDLEKLKKLLGKSKLN